MSKLTELYIADLSHAVWRTSSYTANNGNCVEVAEVPGMDGIAVRDSKKTHIPAARVTTRAWSAFVSAVADGALSPGR